MRDLFVISKNTWNIVRNTALLKIVSDLPKPNLNNMNRVILGFELDDNYKLGLYFWLILIFAREFEIFLTAIVHCSTLF